jgi:hypothetical protein
MVLGRGKKTRFVEVACWSLRSAKGYRLLPRFALRLRRCPADGWPAGGLFISSPMSGCGSCFSLPLPPLLLTFLSLLWFLFFRSVVPFPVLSSFSDTGALLFVFTRFHITCDVRASDFSSKRKAKPQTLKSN